MMRLLWCKQKSGSNVKVGSWKCWMFSDDWKWLLSDDIMQWSCTHACQWASCSSHKAPKIAWMKVFPNRRRQSTTKQKEWQYLWIGRRAWVIAARQHINSVGLKELHLSRPRCADFHHLGEGNSVRRGLKTCSSCDVNVIEQVIQPEISGLKQREGRERNSSLF